MFSSLRGRRCDSISLHPLSDAGSAWPLVKTETAGLAFGAENKIENMKDWSASEEAFTNSTESTWLSLFGGQKAVITNHPI